MARSAPVDRTRRGSGLARHGGVRGGGRQATDQPWWDLRILLDFIGDEDWSPPHSLATAEAYLEALLARL